MTPELSSDPRFVLITGASSGIGEACAMDLAAHGFRVFAGVRKTEDGERLRQKNPERITPLRIDVTEMATIEAAAKEIAASVGSAGLAGLVNNAGIAVAGPVELLPLDALRHQMEVNFIGQIAVIQTMMPMLRAACGRIVNISSLNGILAPPYFGAYSASKFALEAASCSLRVELRQWGIKVVLIEPGAIETAIWDRSHRMADDLTSRVSPEKYELYREDLEKVTEYAKHVAAHALPVQRVADKVREALTVVHPRARYPIGKDPKLALYLGRFLPARWLDHLICKSLNIRPPWMFRHKSRGHGRERA
jgi:NAD(P)-dependent dehydrogenase (short-subunit alcohol dehydrogenase family)